MDYESIKNQAAAAARELIEAARLRAGQLVAVGCSSSEIAGRKMGTASDPELGKAVFEGIFETLAQNGIFLAAQCCEHLNRALVLPRAAAAGYEPVNAAPRPKAGGAFATAAYRGLPDPVVVEAVFADAGLDIGGTLIGMHLKRVAVPLRLASNRVGEATVAAARTRPKFIGGVRAAYDEGLL